MKYLSNIDFAVQESWSYADPKHEPDLHDFTGAIPKWMINAAGGTEEAAQALTKFGYSADSGSYGHRKVIELIQEMLIKLGFDKVYGVKVTGKIDHATNLALKFRMGHQWEMQKFRDIVWELQSYIDRGDYYPLGEEPPKKHGLFSWPMALILIGAIALIGMK